MVKIARSRGSQGFTLIEIMIVLAVLAVLAAVVVPNVSGFLGRGKDRAFEADSRMLQAAVDAWRTDISARAGNPWPTVGGVKGAPADSDSDGVDIGTDSSVIKLSLLSPSYVKGTDVVRSFAYSTGTGSGATNASVGSYLWYVDTNGLVKGRRWTDVTGVGAGIVNLAELAASDGFAPDVYP